MLHIKIVSSLKTPQQRTHARENPVERRHASNSATCPSIKNLTPPHPVRDVCVGMEPIRIAREIDRGGWTVVYGGEVDLSIRPGRRYQGRGGFGGAPGCGQL
jgi:hypothetical protein